MLYKRTTIPSFLFYIFLFFGTAGCTKETSHYYPDKQTPGTAIFSNTGNNVLSCFIDGRPWQTISRSVVIALFSRPIYEVYIQKQITGSTLDTLSILWEGHYNNDQNGRQFISLVLPVAKNFSLSDLSAMEGKRISIDSSNGFFTVDLQGVSQSGNQRGKGTIYFNRLRFDSSGTGYHSGRMAGIFEADFGSFKITSGRFDHNLDAAQVRF